MRLFWNFASSRQTSSDRLHSTVAPSSRLDSAILESPRFVEDVLVSTNCEADAIENDPSNTGGQSIIRCTSLRGLKGKGDETDLTPRLTARLPHRHADLRTLDSPVSLSEKDGRAVARVVVGNESYFDVLELVRLSLVIVAQC